MAQPRNDKPGRGRGWPLIMLAVTTVACEASDAASGQGATPSAATETATASASASTSTSASTGTGTSRREELTLIAGGDLFFGRSIGQQLLANPQLDPFDQVQGWLRSADLRFGNLECQLSDQGGETGHPDNNLVFTGPPAGADVLARAGFDIVSTANNHMWDYGKDALWETFANLERVGVAYVGAGRTRERAYGHVTVEREGFRVAFLAVTDIWNMGPLHLHPAREFVARADPALITEAVAPVAADSSIDAVVVSYHGGSEYIEGPVETTRSVVHAAIDAGADIVIGHHPHVAQGVGWYRGKPILYSLGNFTMGMNGEHPWSQFGYLARIKLHRDAVPEVEACPYRLNGFTPIPLWRDGTHNLADHFFRRFSFISKHVAGSDIGSIGSDGCASVRPPSQPVPGALP